MIKIFLLFALVASASALQDAAPEAGPEPYSYAYQTDSHGAAEQRDPAGRVQGYYTLADADGRERRVEYVADENGFRAKVQTNEMGTKAESPANVEVQAAEPSPAQYAAAAQYSAASQYSAGTSAAAAAAAQGAQVVRQGYTTTSAAAAPVSANYAANYQQYAYRPYGATSYYASGAYPYAYNGYGSNYNSAYGGYGTGYGASSYYAGGFPSGAYYSSVYPSNGYYGYTTGYAPASQYYSYRSSTGAGAAAPAPAAAYSTTGTASGYRFYNQPAGAVTTTYRQVSGVVPAPGVATYSAGFPTGAYGVNGATTYSAGFPAASFGVNAGATGSGSSSSASRSFQGSSNYIVLKKRDAEGKQEKAAASS